MLYQTKYYAVIGIDYLRKQSNNVKTYKVK